jgi:hypothetical protein
MFVRHESMERRRGFEDERALLSRIKMLYTPPASCGMYEPPKTSPLGTHLKR